MPAVSKRLNPFPGLKGGVLPPPLTGGRENRNKPGGYRVPVLTGRRVITGGRVWGPHPEKGA